jgi:hypothetical protein
MTRLVLATALLFTAAAPAADDGFRDLFDGKSLDGWVVEGPDKTKDGLPMWSVEDGRVVCLGKAFGFLRYDKKEFADFTLRVEYRFAPKSKENPQQGNSGIGIRMGKFDPKKSAQTRASYASYEIQLLDDAGKPANAHSTGSLYRYKAPTANPSKPAPEWNSIEVTCAGPKYTVRLNGETILEADQNDIPDLKDKPAGTPAPKDKPLKGYVAVQSHSGKVEFRKIQIRER